LFTLVACSVHILREFVAAEVVDQKCAA
jgi:hypothetical protein